MCVLFFCAIIRFATFAPSANYWSRASDHNNMIANHVELHNGIYSMKIASGEEMAARWGKIAFYWNLAVWVPSFWFLPPFNILLTTVDTVITVYLSMATHYQTGYTPHNKHSCSPGPDSALHNLQRPSTSNESFFETAARLNATTPERLCDSFYEEWQYGVALS